jgi:hypothetical protein
MPSAVTMAPSPETAALEFDLSSNLVGSASSSTGKPAAFASTVPLLLFAFITHDLHEMDDSWRITHDLALGNPSNPNVDGGEDGFSNCEDYLWDSAPKTNHSFPAVSIAGTSMPSLAFASAADRVYSFEQRAELITWQNIGDPIQGTRISLIENIDTTSRQTGFSGRIMAVVTKASYAREMLQGADLAVAVPCKGTFPGRETPKTIARSYMRTRISSEGRVYSRIC